MKYVFMVLPTGPLASTCAPVACATQDLAMGEIRKLETIARTEYGMNAVIKSVEGGNVIVTMDTMRGDDPSPETGALIVKVPYIN